MSQPLHRIRVRIPRKRLHMDPMVTATTRRKSDEDRVRVEGISHRWLFATELEDKVRAVFPLNAGLDANPLQPL
jgi:hypothetical protein